MAKRNDRSQPIPPKPWTEDHAVARAIRTGNNWFDAWLANCSTPMPVIAKKAKIPINRQFELIRGEAPTADEIARLAALWKQSPEALAASIAFANL